MTKDDQQLIYTVKGIDPPSQLKVSFPVSFDLLTDDHRCTRYFFRSSAITTFTSRLAEDKV